MKRTRLRSGLITGALLISAAIAFLYVAPTQIGGSTSYVVTHGNSMEPRFQAGDLALVRPADDYRVGQIVAYRSTVLRVVVLHRIVGRDGDHFIFKGDHNTFLDPTRPTKAQLIGALWVRVPHGGRVLAVLHLPLIAAILTGGCAILLLIGAGEKRRRRARRPTAANAASRAGASSVATHNHDAAAISDRGALLACGVGIVVAIIVALAVGVIAFTRPLHKATTVKVPYSQQIRFGYSATAPAGLVYPSGVVRTGDPVFLRLVRQVNIRTTYTFSAAAPHSVRGTEAIFLRLSGPAGWTRTIQVAPPRRFIGDRTTRTVKLDLQDLESLLARTQSLMGVGAGGAYTLAIVPRVHIAGKVGGQTLRTTFGPSLPFQLSPQQFQLGSATSAAGGLPTGLTPSASGTVSSPATASNTVDIAGLSPTIPALRWGAVVAFVLALLTALVMTLLRRRRSSDPAARIQSKYGELIVPIAALAENSASSPIDVTSIKALVKLAESGQRLILHHHGRSVDTYLVEDAGTIYRYQTGVAPAEQEPDPEAQFDWPVAPEPLPPQPVAAQPEPVTPEPLPPQPVAAQPEPDTPEPLPPQPVAAQPERVTPEPVTPEPEPVNAESEPVNAESEPVNAESEPPLSQPVAPELNGSSEKPLSRVPPAWRALAILAGDDGSAIHEPPAPPSPELPPTIARSVLRPRRRR